MVGVSNLETYRHWKREDETSAVVCSDYSSCESRDRRQIHVKVEFAAAPVVVVLSPLCCHRKIHQNPRIDRALAKDSGETRWLKF